MLMKCNFLINIRLFFRHLDKSSRDLALISSDVSSNSLAPFHSSRLIDFTILLFFSVAVSPRLPPFGALLKDIIHKRSSYDQLSVTNSQLLIHQLGFIFKLTIWIDFEWFQYFLSRLQNLQKSLLHLTGCRFEMIAEMISLSHTLIVSSC